MLNHDNWSTPNHCASKQFEGKLTIGAIRRYIAKLLFKGAIWLALKEQFVRAFYDPPSISIDLYFLFLVWGGGEWTYSIRYTFFYGKWEGIDFFVFNYATTTTWIVRSCTHTHSYMSHQGMFWIGSLWLLWFVQHIWSGFIWKCIRCGPSVGSTELTPNPLDLLYQIWFFRWNHL